MELNKILWAYDGSDQSSYALKYAVFFAKHFNSEMFGLNVNTITDPKYGHYPHYAYFIEKAAKEHDRVFRQKFKEISNDLEKQGVSFKHQIVRGYADEQISKSIEESKADLAVLGITGRGILGKMLMGSTTSKVLEKTGKPVLAVRQPEDEMEINVEKILVPVDISEKSYSAVATSYQLAQTLKCNITLLHAINVGTNLYDFPTTLIDKIITGTRKELKSISENVKKKFEDKRKYAPLVLPKVVFGMNPGLKIADYAKSNRFDLIVMNTHRKKSFKKLILGSVTGQVITNAPCAVMAIKP